MLPCGGEGVPFRVWRLPSSHAALFPRWSQLSGRRQGSLGKNGGGKCLLLRTVAVRLCPKASFSLPVATRELEQGEEVGRAPPRRSCCLTCPPSPLSPALSTPTPGPGAAELRRAGWQGGQRRSPRRKRRQRDGGSGLPSASSRGTRALPKLPVTTDALAKNTSRAAHKLSPPYTHHRRRQLWQIQK